MSIPMGILAPQPRKEKGQPLPIDKLEAMLRNDMAESVKLEIEKFKLAYKIVGTSLVSILGGTDQWISQFTTEDPETKDMLKDVRLLAASDDEVLITGETGTGKELIGKAMIGDRKGKIVAVNCAGLPSELIESELFGHTKGAFTGAALGKEGLMVAAKDGVLFLDEIGELPLHTQAKLLRALQDKKVRMVGGTVEIDITCKFVCATHRDIKQMVEQKLFRQDLYARISTFELHIKPLRDRECDIVPIILSMKGGAEFIEAAGPLLQKLDLSLNVRSLQQAVKRYNVLRRVIC